MSVPQTLQCGVIYVPAEGWSQQKSLEHTGVMPDEVSVPSAKDLASGTDPVMAKTAELLGAKVSPEEAGNLFPYEWPAD